MYNKDAIWDSASDSFDVDTPVGKLIFYKDLIGIVLDFLENYRDKEDKYIQKAIKGRSNDYKVLILLRSERTNYQYKRKYFLGRYTWVKLNGKQIKYMY